MKISIVIPVYNEADALSDCLKSIASQRVKPFEVIVVDNNSSDGSASIAKSFDFVTVINEPRQGVVHARTRGFDYASGDIIARIDADTRLPSDWTKSVKREFKDKDIAAVSGIASYYSISCADFVNRIDFFFRRYTAKKLKSRVFLWGANMAVTKKSWEVVKNELCHKGDLHEDFDLAIHLQYLGYKVEFSDNLEAFASSRRIDTDYPSFVRYVWKSPSTYLQHNEKVLRIMMPLILACLLLYFPGRILYRGYDSEKQGFNILKLFTPAKQLSRVDPTTNVV